jgi:hypothetical protein
VRPHSPVRLVRQPNRVSGSARGRPCDDRSNRGFRILRRSRRAGQRCAAATARGARQICWRLASRLLTVWSDGACLAVPVHFRHALAGSGTARTVAANVPIRITDVAAPRRYAPGRPTRTMSARPGRRAQHEPGQVPVKTLPPFRSVPAPSEAVVDGAALCPAGDQAGLLSLVRWAEMLAWEPPSWAVRSVMRCSPVCRVSRAAVPKPRRRAPPEDLPASVPPPSFTR